MTRKHTHIHLPYVKISSIEIFRPSLTNIVGKTGYPPAVKLDPCLIYPVQVSIQNGLRTFISDLKP
jgi:hypothetical protein